MTPWPAAYQASLSFTVSQSLLKLNSIELVQFSSVTQLCQTLCNPIDCSITGFPVYHQLPELSQTHVHQVGDAIQPSHPLSSPSPPAFNLSQHQGLLIGSQSIGVSASASVLPMNIQDWFLLGLTGWISFCHCSGIICISEVVDVSPAYLNFSLQIPQPGISHDVLST